jgi:hypothetical protein
VEGWVGAVVAGLVLLVNTGVAAYFASKNKRYRNAYSWRKYMEPRHLDLLDWAYNVQTWATKRGLRSHLPPLPVSLAEDWTEDDEDVMDPEHIQLGLLKRQLERQQHERDAP